MKHKHAVVIAKQRNPVDYKANVQHLKLFIEQMFKMTSTVKLNSISDLLEHHLKNDLEIILEILSVKCTLTALNYPNTNGI